MTNTNLIYIGIAGIGIAMLFTVGIGNNLIPKAAGGFGFPITACENAGGTYDHWDKIIFASEGAALRTQVGGTFIKAGTVLEFKFPQINPFQPVNLAQLTADHLNSIGWKLGNNTPVLASKIVIIDVEYTAVCVIPHPVIVANGI